MFGGLKAVWGIGGCKGDWNWRLSGGMSGGLEDVWYGGLEAVWGIGG